MLAECAYALKYSELNHRNPRKPWSIRQTAVYHRYGHQMGLKTSTWVMIAASKRTKGRLHRYIKSTQDLAELNPFEIHLMLLHILLGNWRPYIAHLTEQVTEQVK